MTRRTFSFCVDSSHRQCMLYFCWSVIQLSDSDYRRPSTWRYNCPSYSLFSCLWVALMQSRFYARRLYISKWSSQDPLATSIAPILIWVPDSEQKHRPPGDYCKYTRLPCWSASKWSFVVNPQRHDVQWAVFLGAKYVITLIDIRIVLATCEFLFSLCVREFFSIICMIDFTAKSFV